MYVSAFDQNEALMFTHDCKKIWSIVIIRNNKKTWSIVQLYNIKNTNNNNKQKQPVTQNRDRNDTRVTTLRHKILKPVE